MSSDWKVVGAEMAIDINDVPYDAKSGQWRVRRDRGDRTGTEDMDKRHKLGIHRWLELNLTVDRQEDFDYHVAPTNVTDEDGVDVKLWPYGRGHADGPIHAPTFLVDDANGDFNAQGANMQQFVFAGVSDGPIYLPGE
jgi:hypothetical protein